ncbi:MULTISPECIES: hypothetical protein [unclassified Streptomyces]
MVAGPDYRDLGPRIYANQYANSRAQRQLSAVVDARSEQLLSLQDTA